VEAAEVAPEGAVAAQDTPEVGEASEKAEVGEEQESSEAPDAGEAPEATEGTGVRDEDPLDSPGTADTRELPGEETPRGSVEGNETEDGAEK